MYMVEGSASGHCGKKNIVSHREVDCSRLSFHYLAQRGEIAACIYAQIKCIQNGKGSDKFQKYVRDSWWI